MKIVCGKCSNKSMEYFSSSNWIWSEKPKQKLINSWKIHWKQKKGENNLLKCNINRVLRIEFVIVNVMSFPQLSGNMKKLMKNVTK